MFSGIIKRYNNLLVSTCDTLAQDDTVTKYLNQLETEKNYLWSDLSNFDRSATITNSYKRILQIALCYKNAESTYYNDVLVFKKIVFSLDFMHKNYYSQKSYYDNWWDFEIGTPLVLLKIMYLVDVPNAKNYLDDIYYYQPDPNMSGLRAGKRRAHCKSVAANRVDTVKIAILLAVLKNDLALLNTAKYALEDVFKITEFSLTAKGEERDGIYNDFSFIQHGDIPYTGTYGNVLISGIAEILYITCDIWAVNQLNNIEIIFEFVEKGFFPVIHNLCAMDMVNGRGASRKQFQSIGFGCQIVGAVILLSLTAPQKYAEKYKSFAKYQLSDERFEIFKSYVNSKLILDIANEILADVQIKPMLKQPQAFAFNYMKRLVCIREYFTFALALNSKYIRSYEYMSGENKQGYYTSDGAYWIYTDNFDEYNKDYIATRNPYKVPGATIKDIPIPNEALYYCSPTDNALIMDIDNYYGMACFELDKRKTLEDKSLVAMHGVDTYAKKSYFVLDDCIVALGCDFKGEKLKTYIDTRKISALNKTKTKTNKMLFKDFGYISKSDFTYEEYAEHRSFFDVNFAYTDEKITQNYASLYIEHDDAKTYDYTIVPCISENDFNNYFPSYCTLQNDEKVQAISYKNMLMANFWQAQTHSFIQTDGVACVCVKEYEDVLEVSIIANCKTVNLFIKGLEIISSNAFVVVENTKVEIKINSREKIHVKLKKR